MFTHDPCEPEFNDLLQPIRPPALTFQGEIFGRAFHPTWKALNLLPEIIGVCAHRLRLPRFGLISLFLAPILGDSDISEPGMGLPGFTEDGPPY